MTSTIAIRYAVVTHVISWSDAPSSPRICGIATLTIEVSIVAITDPIAIDTATVHLPTWRGAATGARPALALAVITRSARRRAGCRRAGRRRRRTTRRCAVD